MLQIIALLSLIADPNTLMHVVLPLYLIDDTLPEDTLKEAK